MLLAKVNKLIKEDGEETWQRYKSRLLVWYDVIPDTVLDINSVMTVINDVADSLGI